MEATRLNGEQKFNNLRVIKRNEEIAFFDSEKIRSSLVRIAKCRSLTIDIDLILEEVAKNIYDMAPTVDVEKALIMAAVSFIERDPAYDELAAQLLLQKAYKEVFGISLSEKELFAYYKTAFVESIYAGVEHEIFDKRLLEFDLNVLAQGLVIERDSLFTYLGIQTLYDRYFLKIEKTRYELPQIFWMRIAMGLALLEEEKEKYALEFYEALSTLRYISSTPTLFHAGYKVAQLSSCYLTTVKDDLAHIFKCLGDNAQLAKWAGGIGND